MGKATLVTVNGHTKELDHRPTLREAQTLVGGYIELVKAKDNWGNSVTLVVDEEGKMKDRPTNKSITMVYGQSIYRGYIVGDVIVLEGWKTVGN